jgi:hypothetical protein
MVRIIALFSVLDCPYRSFPGGYRSLLSAPWLSSYNNGLLDCSGKVCG